MDLVLAYSLLYSQCLEWCLAHGRHLVNICWISGRAERPREWVTYLMSYRATSGEPAIRPGRGPLLSFSLPQVPPQILWWWWWSWGATYALLALWSCSRRLWSKRMWYDILVSQMGRAVIGMILWCDIQGDQPDLPGTEEFPGMQDFQSKRGKVPFKLGWIGHSMWQKHSVVVCGALQWIIPLGNTFKYLGIMDS